MIKILLLLNLVMASSSAFAEVNPFEREREPATILDLLPTLELETLDCAPACVGAPICGTLTEMNGCLQDGAVADCFWSCE